MQFIIHTVIREFTKKYALFALKIPQSTILQFILLLSLPSQDNLNSRNATLLVLANARCLPTDLVTEPFSRQLPNCELCEQSSG